MVTLPQGRILKRIVPTCAVARAVGGGVVGARVVLVAPGVVELELGAAGVGGAEAIAVLVAGRLSRLRSVRASSCSLWLVFSD